MKAANSTAWRGADGGGNNAASRCETVRLTQKFSPTLNISIATVKSPMRF